MNLLGNLTVRAKLIAAFGFMFAVVLGTSGFGAYQLHAMHGQARAIQDLWLPATRAISEVKLDFSRERTRAARALGTEDAGERAGAIREQQQVGAQIIKSAAQFEQLMNAEEVRAQLDRFRDQYRRYSENVGQILAKPYGDRGAVSAFNSASAQEWRTVLATLDELGKLVDRGVGGAIANSRSSYDTALLLSLGVLVFSALAAFLAAAWLDRGIVARVVRLSGVMRQLAQRDYVFDLPCTARADEIGDLARAMDDCRTGLKAADALAAEQAREQTAKAERGARLEAAVRRFETKVQEGLGSLSSTVAQMEGVAQGMCVAAKELQRPGRLGRVRGSGHLRERADRGRRHRGVGRLRRRDHPAGHPVNAGHSACGRGCPTHGQRGSHPRGRGAEDRRGGPPDQ